MKEIDVRALACPGPVLELRCLLEEGEPELRMKVADELARINVTRFATSRGADVGSEPLAGGGFLVTIHSSPGSAAAPADERLEDYCEVPTAGGVEPVGKTVVQVSSDRMGVGEEELGAVLMRSFIKTQAQLEGKPQAIVFYNTGVRLCCEGSSLLEDLRSLEQSGVEIIACGTCLNYFSLADQLRVGRGTDMLEIATILSTAGRCVRP